MKIYSNEDLRREFSISIEPAHSDWEKTKNGLMYKPVILTEDEHNHITKQFLEEYFSDFEINGVVYEFDHFKIEETDDSFAHIYDVPTPYEYDIYLKVK